MYALCVALFFALSACNDGTNNNNSNNGAEKDPSVVQPPSEAIPDSMKIVNDSVISPDTVPGNGSQVGNSDSMQSQNF